MARQNVGSGFSTMNVRILQITRAALHVEFITDQHIEDEPIRRFVPQSLVSEDSLAYAADQVGEEVEINIATWWLKKEDLFELA